jgi:hypothetical protein
VHCSSSTRACAPCIMFHHRYSQSSVPTPSARPRRSTHPEGRRELPHEALAYRRARLLLLLVALATLPGLRVLRLPVTLAGEEEGSSPLEVRLLALRSGGAACCCRPRVLRTATGLGESLSSPLSDLSAGASVFDSGCDFSGVFSVGSWSFFSSACSLLSTNKCSDITMRACNQAPRGVLVLVRRRALGFVFWSL